MRLERCFRRLGRVRVKIKLTYPLLVLPGKLTFKDLEQPWRIGRSYLSISALRNCVCRPGLTSSSYLTRIRMDWRLFAMGSLLESALPRPIAGRHCQTNPHWVVLPNLRFHDLGGPPTSRRRPRHTTRHHAIAREGSAGAEVSMTFVAVSRLDSRSYLCLSALL